MFCIAEFYQIFVVDVLNLNSPYLLFPFESENSMTQQAFSLSGCCATEAYVLKVAPT